MCFLDSTCSSAGVVWVGSPRWFCVSDAVPPSVQTGATTGHTGDGFAREAQRLSHHQQWRSGHHPQQDEEGTVQCVPAAHHRPLHHAGDGQLLARGMPHLFRLPHTPLAHMLLQGQKALLQSRLR
ncbi:hypothetical protein AVEN_248645-1 [Araneus ventricosus]|uniref:Uncharacterized protein n=1 Tax=Araneus ventricosus TaxID=182803 RepID=A0A4Y2BZM7_ARAVE|nr:hypothetical protein AVEN_248645-1 [Araneus ventricosus]